MGNLSKDSSFYLLAVKKIIRPSGTCEWKLLPSLSRLDNTTTSELPLDNTTTSELPLGLG